MLELEKILEEIESRMKYLKKIKGKYEDGNEKMAIWFRIDEIKRVKKTILNHMNDGWIPVECKLPKTNGIYNVARHIDGHFISDSSYFDGQNTWHSDNRVNHSRPYLTDVIAWQPLPEPYRPERSGEE